MGNRHGPSNCEKDKLASAQIDNTQTNSGQFNNGQFNNGKFNNGKFKNAWRGIWVALREEGSFRVHLPAAAAVVIAGLIMNLPAARWGLLLLCISTVLAAETFNTAIERACRVITDGQHPEIRNALDMASGAVLITAIGATIVGAIVLM